MDELLAYGPGGATAAAAIFTGWRIALRAIAAYEGRTESLRALAGQAGPAVKAVERLATAVERGALH